MNVARWTPVCTARTAIQSIRRSWTQIAPPAVTPSSTEAGYYHLIRPYDSSTDSIENGEEIVFDSSPEDEREVPDEPTFDPIDNNIIGIDVEVTQAPNNEPIFEPIDSNSVGLDIEPPFVVEHRPNRV